AGVALAEDLPVFDGGDVVVTASGVPQARGVAPVSVSVITAQDIAQSSATSVVDVLATVGGVHLINQGGAEPAVDLRGFGMTGVSNTLVLVDGIRQNTNDQSTPIISNIPLAQIERIEIVRGSGVVQYGEGATGGVINIITKSSMPSKSSASLTQTVGNERLRQTDGNFVLAGDEMSLDAFGHAKSDDGFMRNSGLRSQSGGVGLNLKLDQSLVRVYARSSNESYGLPGMLEIDPVAGINEFQAHPDYGQTYYASPYQTGTQRLDEVGARLSQSLGAGKLYIDLSTRTKYTLTSDASYGSVDNRKVNEDSGQIRYALPFGNGHQIVTGVDWRNAQSSDDNNYYGPSISTFANGEQRRFGVFSEAQFNVWQGGQLNIGGRTQRIDDDLQCLSSANCYSFGLHRELHAWQLGMRQALISSWSGYAKLSQSFRTPNSDDLIRTNGGLQPQLSHEQELGIEWQRESANFRAAVFRSDVVNEIHFMPYLGPVGTNINLDRTQHQGMELEGALNVQRNLRVHANLTWQRATFQDGNYGGKSVSGNEIPQVPSLLANVGLYWSIQENTKASIDVNYVGQQRLDNDQANQFWTEMAGYTLVNTKLTRELSKQVSMSLAVNNLFDRRYIAYGVIDSSGQPLYTAYPGDPRTYQASVTMTF
ncbi:TonB-dependent receptor, partial [Paludibacterium sp.]|uniref:TonB-dependent receptor n=2 Tax=Paludibacterium sp. TaxID=1917523 RepID=UPI0025F4F51A